MMDRAVPHIQGLRRPASVLVPTARHAQHLLALFGSGAAWTPVETRGGLQVDHRGTEVLVRCGRMPEDDLVGHLARLVPFFTERGKVRISA